MICKFFSAAFYLSQLRFLARAETGGSISAVSSDPPSAGFFHDQRLVIELDLPLMFTLVSHQRSRRVEEKLKKHDCSFSLSYLPLS